MMWRKWIKTVLVSLTVLYALATALLYASMRQTLDTFGAIMAHVPMITMKILPFQPLWMSARAGHLVAGDRAPDFDLPLIDHSATLKLSSEYRQGPVVLVFGSYT